MVRECHLSEESFRARGWYLEQTHAGYFFSMRQPPGEQVAES